MTCLRIACDSFFITTVEDVIHADLQTFNLAEILFQRLFIYLIFFFAIVCIYIFFTHVFFLESISNTFFSFVDFHHGFFKDYHNCLAIIFSKDAKVEEGLLFPIDKPIFGRFSPISEKVVIYQH